MGTEAPGPVTCFVFVVSYLVSLLRLVSGAWTIFRLLLLRRGPEGTSTETGLIEE